MKSNFENMKYKENFLKIKKEKFIVHWKEYYERLKGFSRLLLKCSYSLSFTLFSAFITIVFQFISENYVTSSFFLCTGFRKRADFSKIKTVKRYCKINIAKECKFFTLKDKLHFYQALSLNIFFLNLSLFSRFPISHSDQLRQYLESFIFI